MIVVRGGTAGFFCALSAAEVNPNLRILVLDGGKIVLRKVRNSGGGRCNLTHHCFDPKKLSERYPRGGRQLGAPIIISSPRIRLNGFPKVAWPRRPKRTVECFQFSDCSQSVIDCLEKNAREARVEVWTECKVREIDPPEAGNPWSIKLGDRRVEKTEKLCLAMGSLAHSVLVQIIENLDHQVVPFGSLVVCL